MISVVIPTHESERLLAYTLAALVPGALEGLVREVIVADAGSQDETAKVADVAGCRFMVAPGDRGAALAAAAAMARAHWLWFVQPGSIPDPNWIDEIGRFVCASEGGHGQAAQAAVFRARPRRGRSHFAEALKLIGTAIGRRPRPAQGLLIAKPLYRRIGAHKAGTANPERDFMRRLGRRQIVVLGCGMTQTR
ncbi:MAG: glycosyltransferase [Hyphomicrobiales bacterium]|nr:glycosyltransferase [Hyphomicrobiales bacterium]